MAGVPLVVALAWTGGLYPVWVAAGLLTRWWAARVVSTAIGAVGWDLFLDPQMVADGQWTWCAAGWGLPGLAEIPYSNYLGWFAVALVMGLLLIGLDHAVRTSAANMFAAPTAEHPPSAAQTQLPMTEHPSPTAQAQATKQLLSTAQAQVPTMTAADLDAGTLALQLGTTSPEHGSRAPVAVFSADVVVPVAVFVWTWLGSTLAHAVFLELPHSAWYGCVGLGVLGVPLLARLVAVRQG